MNLKEETQSLFASIFDYLITRTTQALGHVNLIGKHANCNGDFVLPCAASYRTVIDYVSRSNRKVRVMAAGYENQLGELSFDASIVAHESYQWADYVCGVVKHLQLHNNGFGDVDMVVNGSVPQGIGLSSSASLEVVVGTVLQQLYHLPLDGAQIALDGQEAENQFVDCSCGIMDQLVSILGKKGHTLLIDCRSLGTKAASTPKGVTAVITNSSFKRILVGSEYGTRREQCEADARFFRQSALHDITIEEFNAVTHELDPTVTKRVRRILTEDAHTVEAASVSEQGDLKRMGELMAESHASMRDDLGVAIPQADTLVKTVKAVIGNKGDIRMTGGGPGGYIITLFPEELVLAVQQAVAE